MGAADSAEPARVPVQEAVEAGAETAHGVGRADDGNYGEVRGVKSREEVIKGLECCEKKVCIFRDTEKECPYWELCGEYEGAFEDCTTALAKDVLALLKAQEPRVMTLEEVKALDWDYCYLEQERLPGKEYRRMLGKYIITCVTWPSITASKITYGAENYGKTWRCWTSRPDNATREATPWN